jgi:hypothetical protein
MVADMLLKRPRPIVRVPDFSPLSASFGESSSAACNTPVSALAYTTRHAHDRTIRSGSGGRVMIRGKYHLRTSVADQRRPKNALWTQRLLLSAAVGFVIYLPTAARATDDPPPLHPGLWEARTSFPSRPNAGAEVTRVCIDRQTQGRMLQQTSLAMLHMCSRHEYGMHAGRFVTSSYCTIAGSIIEGRTETTFSHDTAYHTEVVGRITPVGRTVASQRTTIDARYVGKCPADMKAGDMTLPNGQRLNLLEMSAVLAR